ncbi:MAG: carbohydrate porin [Bacteroidetes bacterium]|nr:carbohydrate porin [Bacteroidota bacterium]
MRLKVNKNPLTLLSVLFSPLFLLAGGEIKDSTKPWSFHFQQTIVGQYHPKFKSLYEGNNTFTSAPEEAYSLTSTLYIGRRLWKGAEFYFNPEIAGGKGLSKTLGIGGFPNGETFRVGDPAPALYVARLFFTQYFALGNEEEKSDDEANSLQGKLPAKRLSITLGKISIADYFDGNKYSHDPRTQFLNWGLMSAGGWDYPANTRGYTWAGVVEYITPNLSVRASSSMVGEEANGPYMDMHFGKANSTTLEVEKPYTFMGKNGRIRAIGFYTLAHMGNYTKALSDSIPDITRSRQYGRTKYGAVLNIEQDFSEDAGAFFRASWNDGKNETWAFTEIDNSLSAGIVMQGTQWKRKDDKLGVAILIDGLSKDHRTYLARGGYGFIIGDGKLNYANEFIVEAQYNINLHKNFWITPDYQFIMNPGYNKDRGPVNIFGLRGHCEF